MNEERYSIKSGFVLREIAGEFIAVPVNDYGNSVGMLVLNQVSAVIWDMLQSERTLLELTDQISSEFDVSKAEAEADIVAFIDELRKLGLLV